MYIRRNVLQASGILHVAIIFLFTLTRKHLYSSYIGYKRSRWRWSILRIQKHASLFWHTSVSFGCVGQDESCGSHVKGLLYTVRERWLMSRGGLNKTSAYRRGPERNCPATYRVATGTPKQETAIRTKWLEAASHSWLKGRFVTRIPTLGIAATWADQVLTPSSLRSPE